MPSVIRYPGSKAKLASTIRESLPRWLRHEHVVPPAGAMYVEPFFGSGAVGLEVLEHANKSVGVWLNDLDFGIYALWRAVLEVPDRLVEYVRTFTPTEEAFEEFKAKDGRSTGCIARDGFRKLALHRTSVSGFGAKSGSALGGKAQRRGCNVGSRWNPAAIEHAIYNAHVTLRQFADVRVTNLHVRDVLREVRRNWVVYLDPPYFVKGEQCYVHSMSEREHEELSATLRELRAEWRLSYDDCPLVRELYAWASFGELTVRYTNAVTSEQRVTGRELLISPMGLGELCLGVTGGREG
jgi:DNA adenine methylase